jgi:hypothetical protein
MKVPKPGQQIDFQVLRGERERRRKGKRERKGGRKQETLIKRVVFNF